MSDGRGETATERVLASLQAAAGEGSGLRWGWKDGVLSLSWSSFQPSGARIEGRDGSWWFLTVDAGLRGSCIIPERGLTPAQAGRWCGFLARGNGEPWRFPAPEMMALCDRLRRLITRMGAGELQVHEGLDEVGVDRVEDRVGTVAGIRFRPDKDGFWRVSGPMGRGGPRRLTDAFLRRCIGSLDPESGTWRRFMRAAMRRPEPRRGWRRLLYFIDWN